MRPSPRRPRSRPALLAAATVLIGFGAAAQSAAAATALTTCSETRAVKPRGYVFACGDGNLRIEGLRWSAWGGPRATTRATLVGNSCVPSCAEGSRLTVRARVTAYGRRGPAAKRRYTRIRVRADAPLGGDGQRVYRFVVASNGPTLRE